MALILFLTGPGLLAFGGAAGCVSLALFLDPTIIENSVRFENPAAKRATACFIAALMGLIAVMVALVPVLLMKG